MSCCMEKVRGERPMREKAGWRSRCRERNAVRARGRALAVEPEKASARERAGEGNAVASVNQHVGEGDATTLRRGEGCCSSARERTILSMSKL